jgi:hypothetical protein
MDEQMMAGEQREDSELDQILQLCQSGNPQALGEIAKIVTAMKAAQEQEEGSIGAEGTDGEAEAPQGMAQRVMNRIKDGQ